MKTISLAVLALAGAALTAPPACAAGVLAGAAKVDITPDRPIRLSGYGARTAPSEGIEDRIHVRALAIKDAEGTPTVIISLDAIGTPGWLWERTVGAIRGRTGIYHVRLAIASTHTHYAPCLAGSIPNIIEMTPEEEDVVRAYSDDLAGKVVQAIDEALARLEPATLQYGVGKAAFAKNRRPKSGPVLHEVPVLAVRSANGKPLAVVFNYACHATTMEANFNRVSADWPGEAARLLEEAHPGAVALPLIGCGADANPQPRGELAQSRQHGRELAAAVEAVLAGPLATLPGKIDAQLEYVQLPFAKVPSKEELEARLASGPAHVRRHARLLLARLDSEGRLAETQRYPIQVWAFGQELTLVFLAGEVVVDYALRIAKELAPKRVWVTAYANDIPCYIASRRVLDEGGYEADDSMVWYGQPSRWAPAVEDLIIEKVRALAATTADPAARVKPPPPKEPKEALATLEVAAGLRVELAAAEPQITDPVAIAFDEQGRMYAAEMRDYPLGPGDGKAVDGRVRLLSDEDGDGFFERSSIFAERIPYANGIACSQGGVFVTGVPDLLFLKDTDGDGKDDVRRTVYTGFRPGNSQHLLNSLSRSLDNWIHANGGDLATVTCVADPSVPALPLAHSNFRFHPLTLKTEAATGYRGGFGITFHERGDRFLCDNQDHAVEVVLEREHLALNPDLRIEETMDVITDHGARIFPASRTLERFNDPQDYGRFSAACGVHIYGGDALPEPYRGSLFSCDPVSNLVHRDVLVPKGVTFSARRGEEGTDFLRSTDHWFRPVNCATGPDGALYIADMYREVIEHPQWIPEHIQRYFDLRSGMDRGRVYRVTAASAEARGAGAAARRRLPDLGSASAKELVATLAHPNSWHRETAQRLLIERGKPAAAAPAEAALTEDVLRASPSALGRLHALWTLEGLGALRADLIAKALEDAAPAVRGSAAALAGRRLEAGAGAPADPGTRLLGLAEDPDARVRFEVALALHALPPERRAAPLTRIALQDAADPWARTAILASWGGDLLPLITALAGEGDPGPGRADFLERALDLAGARKRPGEVAGAILLLTRGDDAAGDRRLEALASLFRALGAGGLARVLDGAGTGGEGAVPAETAAEVRRRLDVLFARVAVRAGDDSAALADRVAAANLLGAGAGTGVVSLLAGLIDVRYPADLQLAAARGLGRVSGPEATAALLAAFARGTPRVRGEVLDALIRDTSRAGPLIAALERGDLQVVDFDLNRRKSFLEALSVENRKRVEPLFARLAADPDRAAVVEKYRQALGSAELAGAGDAAHGKDLFLKKCALCHRAGDQGTAVGADLSGMRVREVDALLADILDPSRAVAPEFLSYVLITRDGQALSGLLALETPSNVVIRGAEGKTETFLRRDIEALRATSKSFMPDGFEKEFAPRDLRDVIAFIKAGLEGQR